MPETKLQISIEIEHAAWLRRWPTLRRDTRALFRVALADPALGSPKGEVALVFSNDARLRDLNSQFRGKHKPTNVLSFPDGQLPLGGIALAFETVRREAALQKKRFVNHSKHLIIHGFLHLLGFDHMKEREARLMEQREASILAKMGIPDPYTAEKQTRA